MLEEAVAQLKDGGADFGDEQWSPQINIGTPVLIPENYVADLQLRLQLYRRLGDVTEAEEIDSFGAELIDRFGPLPEEVQHLLKIVFITIVLFFLRHTTFSFVYGIGISGLGGWGLVCIV